jgi:hypothetical protein
MIVSWLREAIAVFLMEMLLLMMFIGTCGGIVYYLVQMLK